VRAIGGGAVNPRISLFEGRSAKSFSFKAPAGSTGIFYIGGFYNAPLADANLDEVGPIQTYGSANNMYAAHAFIVAGAAGVVNGNRDTVT